MTYRQFADHVKQQERLKLKRMRQPEDDWLPEIFFEHASGIRRQPLAPQWFSGRELKSHLIATLAEFITVARPQKLALVVVMFMLSSEHPMGQVIAERAREHPERSPTEGLPYFQDVAGSVEQLWVHILDAERHEGWYANITRPGSGAPRLAPFAMAGVDAIGGDLTDPLKEALR